MATPNTESQVAASKEDIDKLAGAVRGYQETTLASIEKNKAEFAATAEKIVRDVLGADVFPEFKRIEQAWKDELKTLDQSKPNLPLSVRALVATRDDQKLAGYQRLGAMGVAAWCQRDRIVDLPEQTRAQLGLTENKGGAAIPTLVDEEWAYVMLDHSVARQMLPPSRQIPLDESLTVVWPTITVRPSASQGTENNNSGGTDATLATQPNSNATAAIIKGWIPFSKVIPPRQLAIMQAVIGTMLAEDLGNQEDEWFFNSSSPFTGMLQAATGKTSNVTADGASSVDALQDINPHAFFAKMKRSIQPNHIGKGVFVFNPETWGVIEGLTDNQNRPLYGTGPMGSTPAQFPAPVSVPTELRLLNRPVYLTSTLPGVDAASGAKFCLYMDPSAAGIASRLRETTVDESVEAKELNRVIIAWELFALRLLLPTCAVAGVLA